MKSFANTDSNTAIPYRRITPNEHGDWLAPRKENFAEFLPLIPEQKGDPQTKSFFTIFSMGVVTSRDAWVYNFSQEALEKNIQKTIAHYNEQRKLIREGKQKEIQKDATLGSWSRDWEKHLKNNKIIRMEDAYRIAQYRPFEKRHLYFAEDLNEEGYRLRTFFPFPDSENLVIALSCKNSEKGLSVLITDTLPDLHFVGDTQCFPLYWYEPCEGNMLSVDRGYIRRDAISDFIYEEVKNSYGEKTTKEDIFYYVYGILHSPAYRETFAVNLKKDLPRLPLVEKEDFWKFVAAGRALAELHLHYEKHEKPESVRVVYKDEKNINYEVEKMRFPKKEQQDTICYNSEITLVNIPPAAYEYVVNGKSAIKWVMEKYKKDRHKESEIENNPNEWARENPRYILDLLLSVIHLSLRTVEIVKSLPSIAWDTIQKTNA